MPVTVAATQMACSWNTEENLAKAEGLIRSAAAAGAQIILPQEVFSSHEFQFFDMKPEHFKRAETLEGPTITRMRHLAKDLGVVIPANFFEVANNAYYNTNAIIDADGRVLGIYRKSHIPLGLPGCYEKVYSNPGDTGFLAFKTAYATIGTGICWDQWFPESARIMALKGAEILFYPTAIGSDCHDHWEIVMRGHAGANIMPLVAANRVGHEKGDLGDLTFWGRSFIAGPRGDILAKADDTSECFITASFDLEEIRELRAHWGVFRDRRPDLYGPLLTSDGATPAP